MRPAPRFNPQPTRPPMALRVWNMVSDTNAMNLSHNLLKYKHLRSLAH